MKKDREITTLTQQLRQHQIQEQSALTYLQALTHRKRYWPINGVAWVGRKSIAGEMIGFRAALRAARYAPAGQKWRDFLSAFGWGQHGMTRWYGVCMVLSCYRLRISLGQDRRLDPVEGQVKEMHRRWWDEKS